MVGYDTVNTVNQVNQILQYYSKANAKIKEYILGRNNFYKWLIARWFVQAKLCRVQKYFSSKPLINIEPFHATE